MVEISNELAHAYLLIANETLRRYYMTINLSLMPKYIAYTYLFLAREHIILCDIHLDYGEIRNVLLSYNMYNP